MAGERVHVPLVIGGERSSRARRSRRSCRTTGRTSSPTWSRAPRSQSSARSPPARGAHAEWAATPWHERAAIFLRAAELLAGPWRSTLNAATMLGQSQDRAPGRDRRGLRAVRLLPLQRRVHACGSTRSSRSRRPGRVEPAGVPPARGLRLRRHAVQLHRDRRQPADGARADGQHGRLEAGVDGRAARRTIAHGAARGGRPAAGRDQLRVRARRGDRRRRAREARSWRASTSRARPRCSSACGGRSARTSRATGTTRASSARPAARTSSSRTRPPTPTRSRRRSCAARSSTRGRSARPRPAPTSRPTCGRRSAIGCRRTSRDRRWATSATSELHGRGHRRRRRSRRRPERSPRRERPAREIVAGGGATTATGWFVEPTVIETDDPGFRLMRDELFGPVVTMYVYDDEAAGTRRSSSSTRRRRTR